MKVERLIRHLNLGIHDPEQLKAAGSLLGHKLPSLSEKEVWQVLSEIAKIHAPADTYAAGYIMAMRDILFSFALALRSPIEQEPDPF